MAIDSSNGRRSGAARTLVMTGGTSGFGRRMLERVMTELPAWRVILLARPSPRLDSLVAAAAGSGRLETIDADLASLSSVSAAIDAIEHRLGGRPIDALALNAGLQAISGDQASADGLELSFAVNHLAHFLLAERLAPRVRDGGRIVVTSSVVHDPDAWCLVGITRGLWQEPRILADPVRSQAHFLDLVDRGEARYSVSKLLNLMTVRHLAVTHRRIACLAFNPSVVPGTEIARERNVLQVLGWKYLMPLLAPALPGARSLETSAGDLLWLVTEADAMALTGAYVDGRVVAPGSAASRDSGRIEQLVAVSRALLAETRATPATVPGSAP